MRRIFLIAAVTLFTLSSIDLHPQNVNKMGLREITEDTAILMSDGIPKSSISVLAIGIQQFSDPLFSKLPSAKSLKEFKRVADDYLPLSYHNVEFNSLSSNVSDRMILDNLEKLVSKTDIGERVVIISILSHGIVEHGEDGEYYLICSNTSANNYQKTAISGSVLRSYFERMANQGAIVLVFIDTCHAGALFDKSDYVPLGNTGGGIAYCASSNRNEDSNEIDNSTAFSDALTDAFLNKNNTIYAIKDGKDSYATVYSLQNTVATAVNNLPKKYLQTAATQSFYKSSKFDDISIIKKKELVPYGSLFKHPEILSPLSVSPNDGKYLDYTLIGVESLSVLGFIGCGIAQEVYKSKIRSNEFDAAQTNEYRLKGKNATWGCLACLGTLLISYAVKTGHVYFQSKKQHRENQYATIDIAPTFSPTYGGLSLVYKF